MADIRHTTPSPRDLRKPRHKFRVIKLNQIIRSAVNLIASNELRFPCFPSTARFINLDKSRPATTNADDCSSKPSGPVFSGYLQQQYFTREPRQALETVARLRQHSPSSPFAHQRFDYCYYCRRWNYQCTRVPQSFGSIHESCITETRANINTLFFVECVECDG